MSDEVCSDKTFGDAVDGFEDKVENENRALTASDLIAFIKKSEEKRRKEQVEDIEKLRKDGHEDTATGTA